MKSILYEINKCYHPAQEHSWVVKFRPVHCHRSRHRKHSKVSATNSDIQERDPSGTVSVPERSLEIGHENVECLGTGLDVSCVVYGDSKEASPPGMFRLTHT
jgi:hypothetical protein